MQLLSKDNSIQMENGFNSQSLNHPALVLAGLPEALRMQLGPFNPQIQDAKGLNIHSLNASAFRLRYASNYPGFPAHLIHHFQPQLFPTAVDPRVHLTAGAFRPFNISSSPNKLFSAFAPPHKSESHSHDSAQELSPGNYASKLYGSENDEEPGFRSQSEREVDLASTDHNAKQEMPRSASTSTPSPKSSSVKEEKIDVPGNKGFESGINMESDNSSISNSEDERNLRRSKLQFDPACCPICGIIVLLGETESHFFKELERLSQITSGNRDRKYIFDKSHHIHSCFPPFGNSYLEENGHSSETGMPRGRWETYQRIKSNRLSRLRIKSKRRKSGDPLCPVCNEKMQGNVEDINLHVEHCLKKHSDEAEEEEEENIDVEGDSDVYGDYEWPGRHLIRATTFLVGGFAVNERMNGNNRRMTKTSRVKQVPIEPFVEAGLLTSTSSGNHRTYEKEEESSAVDGEDSSALTPIQLSDPDVNMTEEESSHERDSRNSDRDGVTIVNPDALYPMPKCSGMKTLTNGK